MNTSYESKLNILSQRNCEFIYLVGFMRTPLFSYVTWISVLKFTKWGPFADSSAEQNPILCGVISSVLLKKALINCWAGIWESFCFSLLDLPDPPILTDKKSHSLQLSRCGQWQFCVVSHSSSQSIFII